MENKDFEYNYSAPTSEERREIESIRNSYKQKSETEIKLDRLRSLDFKVKNIPMTLALIVGILGLLIFGLGLTMVLEWKILVWGIVLMVVGLIPMIIAYPLFMTLHKKLKNKHIEEILKLSEELLKDENK